MSWLDRFVGKPKRRCFVGGTCGWPCCEDGCTLYVSPEREREITRKKPPPCGSSYVCYYKNQRVIPTGDCMLPYVCVTIGANDVATAVYATADDLSEARRRGKI